MSDQLNPLFNTVEYTVADSEKVVNAYLSDGWELHGETTFLTVRESGKRTEVRMRQAMVRKEQYSFSDYMSQLKTLLLLVNSIGNIDFENLFNEDELAEMQAAILGK